MVQTMTLPRLPLPPFPSLEGTNVSSLVCVLPDSCPCIYVQRMFTYTDHGARPAGSTAQLCYSLAV